MVVASNTGVRVLCTVVNGSCSKLRSAVVSPVVTVAFVNRLIQPIGAILAIGSGCYYELLTMYIRCLCIRQPLI